MSFMGEPIFAADDAHLQPVDDDVSPAGVWLRRFAIVIGLFALLGAAAFGMSVRMVASTGAGTTATLAYPVRIVIPQPMVMVPERASLTSPDSESPDALAEPAAPETSDNASNTSKAPVSFDTGAFKRAFEGLLPVQQTSKPRSVQPLPKPDKSGMLAIDFDLQGGAQSARSIAVQKPVTIAGAQGGKLSVRVDGAAKIYANRAEVAALLDGKSDKADRVRNASEDEYLSFQQLRDLGVDIRYDPSNDRIIIPAGD